MDSTRFGVFSEYSCEQYTINGNSCSSVSNIFAVFTDNNAGDQTFRSITGREHKFKLLENCPVNMNTITFCKYNFTI